MGVVKRSTNIMNMVQYRTHKHCDLDTSADSVTKKKKKIDE